MSFFFKETGVIEKELSKFQNYPKERIQIVNTTEVIETAEPPVLAIRKKKDCLLYTSRCV